MRRNSNIKSLYTGLLLALFMSPQLMGTLHHAFMHHDDVHKHEGGKLQLSQNEKECAWCDFHFLPFLHEDFAYGCRETITHTFRQDYNLFPENVISTDATSRKGRAPPCVLTSA